MAEPSIKGSAFVGVVEDLRNLLANEDLSREELEERLELEDLVLLDEEISPGFWYPMASYDRMLELLVATEGAGDRRAYLLGRGERAMKRMMDLGLYNQFSSLERGWTRLSGRVMSTMASVVYNFLTFEIVSNAPEDGLGESDRFVLLIKDGGRLSENAQLTIEGAVATLSTRAAHGPVRVWGRRVSTEEVEIYAERVTD